MTATERAGSAAAMRPAVVAFVVLLGGVLVAFLTWLPPTLYVSHTSSSQNDLAGLSYVVALIFASPIQAAVVTVAIVFLRRSFRAGRLAVRRWLRPVSIVLTVFLMPLAAVLLYVLDLGLGAVVRAFR